MFLFKSGAKLTRTSQKSRHEYKDLAHTIEIYGWETGIRQFLLSLPEQKQRQFSRTLRSASVGWRFLLEPKKLDRILCLDTFFGSTALSLSPMCHQLSIIHVDPLFLQLIQQRLNSEGVSNVAYNEARLDGTPLPFPDDHFDGFILDNISQACGPQALFAAQHELPALHLLFTEVYRVLKQDGFAYISIQNKYGYNKLLRMFSKKDASNGYKYEKNQFSFRKLQHAIHDFDFQNVKVYKLITSSNNILEEVILEKNYKSFKNNFLFKERVKQWILKEPRGKFIAPSLGFLCSKRESSPNYLEELTEELKKKSFLPQFSQQAVTVKRYYTLPEKVILSVGQVEKQYGEKIVILPLTSAALERRRHEARILQALHCADLRIAYLIPEFYGEGCLYRQSYLVQQEMPGISIDIAVPQLDEITGRAVQILIELHINTSRETTVGEDVFRALFAQPLHRIIEKLGPSTASSINHMEQILREQFWGRRIKTVWLHGDFKIENVLINPQSMEICGIIDWDLSQQQGLPLLDLLYLIVYNRVIREGNEVEDIFLENIISKNISTFEANIYKDYVYALDLDHHFIEILEIMFWIYHIAYRIEISPWSKRNMEKILKMLTIFEKIIEMKYIS